MLIQELTLHAPISGPIVPLDRVPDPVFAQKLVGDGISIDPITSELIAPFDGTVVQLHRAHHALTLRSKEGVDVLMHIGIDTVALKGVGFTAHVQEGDEVTVGDLLLSFDADYVATKAVSLLTQIIVTNGDIISSMDYGQGMALAGETPILILQMKSSSDATAAADGEVVKSAEIFIPNTLGLHARPSAALAHRAKGFAALITLHKGIKSANVKSVVGLMGLELSRGDRVLLSAQGDDANLAVKELAQLIAQGCGEVCEPFGEVERAAAIEQSNEREAAALTLPKDGKLYGVCASPGLAVGQVWRLERTNLTVTEYAEDAVKEGEKFQQALAKAVKDLQELVESASSEEQRSIFEAHCELISDPALAEEVIAFLQKGKSASWAWQTAFKKQADLLANLKNNLLAARATDMRDIGQRVLTLLVGVSDQVVIPGNVILVADDLTPSDTAKLDPKTVLGFCTASGGASSHVAIIARSLNIPAVAGIDKRALTLSNGTQVVLCASDGLLQIDPPQALVDSLVLEHEAEEILNEAALMVAREPAKTRCGSHIEVVCNIADVNEVAGAPAFGAEGVGLLRSEFLFMQRSAAPTEDEQYNAYCRVVKAFDKTQNIIIRTLDVGGDKPIAYLPLPKEENPFLGLRGIRVSLAYQDIFRTQLRAILRASKEGNVHIMFPMVSTLEELREAKAILEQERVSLGLDSIPVGIMVEVPSVVMLAEQFAAEVDFFSVGTNDLTQYTLAMDRGHPDLAKLADPLNPAVLGMIAKVVEGAHKHNTWVGICGGIASDPMAVPLLIGLGIDELSGSLNSLPRVKAAVRDQDIQQCEALAKKILAVGTTQEVRELLTAHNQH
jgi:phosphoenolpyruvate-protein phosphotransferase